MTTFKRRRRAALAATCAAMFVSACATTPPAPPVTPEPPKPLSLVVQPKPEFAYWPHDVSDLKPDPSIRYGVLPNGMRYALKRNTQPAGIVALRLRIAAGSVMEGDDQEGLAHFLEHMAFNGTENVPEGEMIKLLEREGLAFGPDTNAYTSFFETVYMLDVPSANEARLDLGFKLMRETAGRMLLAQSAIDAEKGVILSEERARDTPESRIQEDRFRFWMPGQRVPGRFPIGTVEDIKGADQEKLKRYYDAFYRPERALFVVTGDMDLDAIEARIKATFADWSARAADPGDPALGALAKRGLEAGLRIEEKGPTNATVTWLAPFERKDDTTKTRALQWERAIATAIVNRRLERIARGVDAPFVSASVWSTSDFLRSARSSTLSVSARPGQWERALAAGEQELRRALTHGFTQAEVNRELAEYRASLESAAAGADTRDTRALARDIVGSFDGRAVDTHPTDDLAIFAAVTKDLTAETAHARLKADFQGAGPLVFLASSMPVPGGADQVKAAFEASAKVAVEAPAARAEKSWPYESFGTPGAVVERKEDADLGVTMVRFANGVRLNVKPTTFEKDEIAVTARFDGGRLSFPSKPGLGWAAPWSFGQGGLGKLDVEELEEATTGRLVGAGLGIGENAFTLGGGTRPADFALQMQLLAAHVVDPGFRGEGLARLQAAHETQSRQLESNPSRLLFRDLNTIVRSGDPRTRFPTGPEAKALTMADIQAVLTPAFAGPIEVTIVGDVTVEEAIRQTAATFGALPQRKPAPTPPKGAASVRFPKGAAAPIVLRHEGRADQAMALVAFKGRDFWTDLKRAAAEELMREMINLRLTDEVRERQGAAYSPGGFEEQSETYPGFGYVAAFTETPPDQIGAFHKTVNEIAAELREGRFDEDLLLRARKPLLEQIETARRTNRYWVNVLDDAQGEPRRLGVVKSRRARLEAVTKADVVAVAKETLRPENAIRIESLPKAQ